MKIKAINAASLAYLALFCLISSSPYTTNPTMSEKGMAAAMAAMP